MPTAEACPGPLRALLEPQRLGFCEDINDPFILSYFATEQMGERGLSFEIGPHGVVALFMVKSDIASSMICSAITFGWLSSAVT